MYYKLEGIAYRRKDDDNNLVYVNKEFKDKNPYIARKKCFEAYQSLMDVFYMSIGQEYTNHEQAVIDLKTFFVNQNKLYIDELDFDKFIDIKIMFNKTEIIDLPKDIDAKEGLLIRSIGSKHNSDLEKAMCLEGLRIEYDLYLINNFPTKNVVIDKKGYRILKTPIDYSNFEYEKDIW